MSEQATDLPVYVHAGYTKCGSTFFQNTLFGRHPEIAYAGAGSSLPTGAAFSHYLLFTKALDYDPAQARQLWRKTLAELSVAGKTAIVYSDANLAFSEGVDPGLVARRLHDVLPAARPLFVIRRQPEFLASIFTHFVMTDKMRLSFEDWLHAQTQPFETNNFFDHADFEETFRWYECLFGAERLVIVLLEDIVADKPAAMRTVCERLGVDPDAGERTLSETRMVKNPDKGIRMARANRWGYLVQTVPLARGIDGLVRPVVPAPLRRALRNAAGLGRRAHEDFPEWAQSRIARRYGVSNRRLGERLGRNLGVLGYPVNRD